MFEVCRIWLVVLGVGLAAGGTVMVIVAGLPALRPLLRLLDRGFWPVGPDHTTRRFEAWAYSVTFATMAGWGVCVAFLAAAGFPTRQIWVWWAVAASLVLWYPLDTVRSVLHRVWINAALNTVVLIVAAVPLALTLGEFR